MNSKDIANVRDVDALCDSTYAELAKHNSSRSALVSLTKDVRKAVESVTDSF